jgi:hypothetical protein
LFLGSWGFPLSAQAGTYVESALTSNPRLPFEPASSQPDTEPTLAQPEVPSPASGEAESPTPQPGLTAWNRWFNRIAMGLFVLFCAILGVWLTLLPWSLQWTDNPLLWTHPDLRNFLSYGFVRGVCSGLGILDLWIGIREVSHYSESPSDHK